MRRVIGLILSGLSGFLLATALMAWFYAPAKLKTTPLNVAGGECRLPRQVWPREGDKQYCRDGRSLRR
jgi:hypothetical protein